MWRCKSQLNTIYMFVLAVLPSQSLLSLRSLKPLLQLHTYVPTVLLQTCLQPPLLLLHSSISARDYCDANETRSIRIGLDVPTQARPTLFGPKSTPSGTVSNSYPAEHAHSNLPTVLIHVSTQPPLFTRHSFVSAGDKAADGTVYIHSTISHLY